MTKLYAAAFRCLDTGRKKAAGTSPYIHTLHIHTYIQTLPASLSFSLVFSRFHQMISSDTIPSYICLAIGPWGPGLRSQNGVKFPFKIVVQILVLVRCLITVYDIMNKVPRLFQYGKQLYTNYQEALKRTEAAYDWTSLSSSSMKSGSSSSSLPGKSDSFELSQDLFLQKGTQHQSSKPHNILR